MIDLEKLKIANELCNGTDYYFTFEYSSKKGVMNIDLHNPKQYEVALKDLDDLIAKLQTLTLPKSKYNKSDMVWFVDVGTKTYEPVYTIRNLEISAIEYIGNDIIYILDHEYQIKECDIYPTRKSLIEAQILYWNKLNCEDGLHEFNTYEHCLWCDYKGLPEKSIKESEKIKIRPELAKLLKEYTDFGQKLINDKLADTGIQVADKQCEHDSDILSKNPQYKLYRQSICGTLYYTDTKTNEITCECGVEADFPHECKCKKCGEVF